MSSTLPTISTRVGGELRTRFDDWRRSQEKIPQEAEAVRQLLDRVLPKLKTTKAKTSPASMETTK